MSKRVKLHHNERLDKIDVEHGFTTFTEEELKKHALNVLADSSQVLDGFRVRIDNTATRLITVFNGYAVDGEGQSLNEEVAPNSSRTVQLPITDGIYAIEVGFALVESDPDSRSFWNPDNDREFTQTVPTRITSDWNVITPFPTNNFTGLKNRVPLIRFQVESGEISKIITDSGSFVDPTHAFYIEIPVSVIESVDTANKAVKVFDARHFPSTGSVALLTSDNQLNPDSGSVGYSSINYEKNSLVFSSFSGFTISSVQTNPEPGDILRVTSSSANIIRKTYSSDPNIKVEVAPRFWLPNSVRGSALRRTPVPTGTSDIAPSFSNVRNLKDFVDAVGYVVDKYNIEHDEADGTHKSVTLPAITGTDQFQQTASSGDSDSDRKFVIFDKSGTPQATFEILADGTVHVNSGANLPSGAEKHLFNVGRETRDLATDESDIRIYRDFSSFVTSNEAKLLFGKDVEDVGSWTIWVKTDGVSAGQMYFLSGGSVVCLFNSDTSVDFSDEVRVGRSVTVVDEFKYSAYKNAYYLWTAGDVSSDEQSGGDPDPGTPEWRIVIPAITSGGRAYVSAVVDEAIGMIPLRFPDGVELLRYWVHFNSTSALNSLDFTLWREGLNDMSDTSAKTRESLCSPSGGFSSVGGSAARFVNPKDVRSDLDGLGNPYNVVDNTRYNYYMQIVGNRIGGALDVDFGGVWYRYTQLNN